MLLYVFIAMDAGWFLMQTASLYTYNEHEYIKNRIEKRTCKMFSKIKEHQNE